MRSGKAALAAALLGALQPTLAGCATAPDFERVIASAGGTGPTDAYRVGSVDQEYEIVRRLGLEVERQALNSVGRRAYDVLTARNPRTGETRDIWFDITSFYGRF